MANSNKTESVEKFYSTSQAAPILGISERALRNLLSKGELKGAFRERANGPWKIPNGTITLWKQEHPKKEPAIGTDHQLQFLAFFSRLKRNPFIFYSSILLSTLLAVFGFLSTINKIPDDILLFRQNLIDIGIVQPIEPAKPGETLIVIANFHYEDSAVNSAAQKEIQRGIRKAGDEAGIENLRVEIDPTILSSDDEIAAKALGEKYNASIVIWGEVTAVHVIVNFSNLRKQDYRSSNIQVDEIVRTQLADPTGYARFITRSLPSHMAFLSLYAISQSYIDQELNDRGADLLNKAVSLLDQMETANDEASEAYTTLGQAYIRLNKLKDADDALTKAISYNPYNARSYCYLAIELIFQKEYDLGLEQVNVALQIDPNLAQAYAIRGVFLDTIGDNKKAIEDLDKAIVLESNKSSKAKFYFLRGIFKGSHDDKQGAIQDYATAIELDPELVEARSYKASEQAQTGEFQGAWNEISIIEEKMPFSYLLYKAKADTYLEEKKLDDALANYNLALNIVPTDEVSIGKSIYVLLTLGKEDDAFEFIKKILDKYPNEDQILYTVSLFFDVVDLPEDPEQLLTRAIEIPPAEADEYLLRGRVYLGKEQYQKAISDFTNALSIDSENYDALIFRCLSKTALNQLKEAEEDCTYAINLYPNKPDAYAAIGIMYNAMGDNNLALKNINYSIQVNPMFDAGYTSKGQVLWAMGDLSGALESYNKVIELKPGDIDYYWSHLQIAAELSDYTTVRQDLEKILQLDPNYVDAYAMFCYIEYHEGNYSKSEANCSKAITLDPKYKEAFFYRGLDRMNSNQIEAGIEDFNTVLTISSDTWEAKYYIGKSYYLLKNYDSALEYLSETINMHSDEASVYKLRSEVYDILGRRKEAEDDYKTYLKLSSR